MYFSLPKIKELFWYVAVHNNINDCIDFVTGGSMLPHAIKVPTLTVNAISMSKTRSMSYQCSKVDEECLHN